MCASLRLFLAVSHLILSFPINPSMTSFPVPSETIPAAGVPLIDGSVSTGAETNIVIPFLIAFEKRTHYFSVVCRSSNWRHDASLG